MTPLPDPLPDPLIDLTLHDLLASLGLAPPGPTLPRSLMRWLLRPAARRFSRRLREFDDRVGAEGLAAGSHWLLNHMSGGLRVAGGAQLPASGPLLVLANHPGMTDTVALFSSLRARPDLRVLALDRPFLHALPHVASHAIFVADDSPSPTGVLRAAMAQLRQGGALLSFPAGAIEPDASAVGCRPAIDALQRWSNSFALLARAVPQTRIVVAVVRQVVSAAALRHPLTRLRRDPPARDRLAASLQILWPPFRRLPALVAFAPPLLAGAHEPEVLRRLLIARASALIASPQAEDLR